MLGEPDFYILFWRGGQFPVRVKILLSEKSKGIEIPGRREDQYAHR